MGIRKEASKGFSDNQQQATFPCPALFCSLASSMGVPPGHLCLAFGGQVARGTDSVSLFASVVKHSVQQPCCPLVQHRAFPKDLAQILSLTASEIRQTPSPPTESRNIDSCRCSLSFLRPPSSAGQQCAAERVSLNRPALSRTEG